MILAIYQRSILTFLISLLVLPVFCQTYYFPERNEWTRRRPADFEISEDKIKEAVNFAQNNEYSGEKDIRLAILKGFSREPYHYLAGPTKRRGGPAGVILKNGYIIAEWGDISRVDMTFSVTKSYLSTVAGVAFDNGYIANTHDKVEDYVWDGTFDGDHNSQITWHHLLTQSSDWSGILFGMKDWADRPPSKGNIDDWRYRPLKTPGSNFEYNDVRVNVLAYSLLQVWRKPLPVVLKEYIMDPIGVSTNWRWYGYENSWIEIDGSRVQSVSGGGHSGGGVFINTLDQARFGLLFLNNGKWGGRQLISEDWINKARKSSEANESYGYMWWLNKGERKWDKGLSEEIYYAAGFGGNYIVIDKENDMVVVTRWLEPSRLGELMRIINQAF